jgi:hypothetical protein
MSSSSYKQRVVDENSVTKYFTYRDEGRFQRNAEVVIGWEDAVTASTSTLKLQLPPCHAPYVA